MQDWLLISKSINFFRQKYNFSSLLNLIIFFVHNKSFVDQCSVAMVIRTGTAPSHRKKFDNPF